MKYYLAIDIGASGGRHILGYVKEGRLICEEVHRFPNGMVEKNGSLCWDMDALFGEILKGMKRCADLGKIPTSVGIDTWGVDFVLLDKNGDVLGDTVAYRDSRTDKMAEAVFELMPESELYKHTGIPTHIFNTIFQLMAVKKSGLLDEAHQILMIPDYLHYRLSGVAKMEYTDATTTGLINAASKGWDDTIIQTCGFPRSIFGEIVPPGTRLGNVLPKVRDEIGYDTQVVVPAAHDTGSAVMAVPSLEDHTLYISSGTWSLMGVERSAPDCSVKSLKGHFANEGGYDYRYRYLKNIMGLWMIQSVKKELEDKYTYGELCELAEQANILSRVDCSDKRFFVPKNMTHEIQNFCKESGQQIPQSPGELASVIYNSLALCYRDSIQTLEQMTGINYPAIHIVGGGANAGYLNQLTAQYTGKKVYAGPTEATAIGNLMAQMIADGVFEDLQAARACVNGSFEIGEF